MPLAQQIKANLQKHGTSEAQLCSLLGSYTKSLPLSVH
ncbi:hypothetical protein M23134_08320 [Microscilla marina ATCC 23134]|uniref:Uncharacterized protein n=1 Tax=Microscilla marina ATCC 23134 TaxID=313606 RepID=A1ZQJ6_MICM2|nr:hypothetical protein M23134_08320 [Microscilla marina ATCC 23134]